jgi:hypothetical protein
LDHCQVALHTDAALKQGPAGPDQVIQDINSLQQDAILSRELITSRRPWKQNTSSTAHSLIGKIWVGFTPPERLPLRESQRNQIRAGNPRRRQRFSAAW